VTTVLRANPRQFVSTPAIERVAARALRYLQSGYSVHLRGPAGTGKTTLALHLADLLARPIMLMFGDDEFKTSDLIGNQTGYTRKKVVDNFIHSVIKVEDELRQNWVDSRLTLACREGFTLVYDEFNRSRPEVNNVLLSALEEKLLVLPPNKDRSEYVRVSPHFRGIFTSNPEEYCGVHSTQDALLDRLITINIPEPDELTQQEIAIQKTGIDRESAVVIVQIVKSFRKKTGAEKSSGLRSCLMLAKICHEHEVMVMPENAEFREICQDLLLSRTALPLEDATRMLWELFNELIETDPFPTAMPVSFPRELQEAAIEIPTEIQEESEMDVRIDSEMNLAVDDRLAIFEDLMNLEGDSSEMRSGVALAEPFTAAMTEVPYEQEVYSYLQQHQEARPFAIQSALGIKRSEVANALQALTDKGLAIPQNNYKKQPSYRIHTVEE
jgi:gas vesicle protein GvpN